MPLSMTTDPLDGTLQAQTGGTTFTLANVFTDHTVEVTFAPAFTITAGAGTGGSVMPASQTVIINSTACITAAPDDGYQVYTWTDNGVLVQTGGTTLSLSNVTADHTVQVTFMANILKLQYQATDSNFYDIPTPFYLPSGAAVTFKAIPAVAGATWPAGQPVWSGSGGANVTGNGDTATATFTAAGTAGVTATCGTSTQSATACVVQVQFPTPPPIYVGSGLENDITVAVTPSDAPVTFSVQNYDSTDATDYAEIGEWDPATELLPVYGCAPGRHNLWRHCRMARWSPPMKSDRDRGAIYARVVDCPGEGTVQR